MKDNYLIELKKLLDGYKMENSEKEDIISDYSDMYDSWTSKGLNDEDVVKKLGNPKSIIRDLTEGYKRVEKPLPGSEKAIALSPFITLIIYFILGFGFKLWHPGWLIFLLIPVTAILFSMGKTKEDHLTTALSPFFAVTTFLLLGFLGDLWHPGWMIFLIIPVIAIWNSRFEMNKLNLLISLSPFAAVTTYIILGLNGFWKEGWVVFFIIPILGILSDRKTSRKIIWISLCILGIVAYLYVGYTYPKLWGYSFFAFSPLVVYSLMISEWNADFGNSSKEYIIVIFVSIILFLGVGLIFKEWATCWMFFLLIPMFAIVKETDKKERAVALTPFIALIIFFTVGYYFNLWHLSWIAFLIIPMTAIIKNA